MKALCRFISFVCLAAAVAAGIFDSIRSVSTSSVDFLSFAEAWQQALPASRTMAQSALAHYIHPEAWRFIENGLSIIPAFAVLLAFSLLFWMAGYRKRRALGFSAA